MNTFKVVAGASAVLPIWDHPNFTDEKWHISEVTTHIIFPKSWLDILILLSKWLYPCCTPILVGCIMRIIGYIPTVSTFWCLIPYSSCFWCLVPYSSCFKPHSCWLMPNSCWPIHANSIFSLVKTSFLFLIFLQVKIICLNSNMKSQIPKNISVRLPLPSKSLSLCSGCFPDVRPRSALFETFHDFQTHFRFPYTSISIF